jgi:hypothetical protein
MRSSSISPVASTTTDAFILSPVLNLPEAFGSAYVGETFSCTLCANNEVSPTDKTRVISGVKIQGEMQTPSTPAGSPLELAGPDEASEREVQTSPAPGESLQRILRFELKEEGNHVLAVTVTYTETTLAGEGMAASGRVRTFRKLYQFVAQQLLSVRTKTGEVGEGKEGVARVLLEAQLENVGEAPISFEVCVPNLSLWFQAPYVTMVRRNDRACFEMWYVSVLQLGYAQGARFSALVRYCSVDHTAAGKVGIGSKAPNNITASLSTTR